MKIKPPSRKNLRKSRSQAYHWWLVDEKPKKVGRLSQRNKANRRLRRIVGPSEFVRMAIAIENEKNDR